MDAEVTIESSLGYERQRPEDGARGPRDSPRPGFISGEVPYFRAEPRRSRYSPRERALLRELIRTDVSHANKQIAFRLGITEGTVKIYFSRLMQKVDVENRYDLALYALKSGMFTMPTPGYFDFDCPDLPQTEPVWSPPDELRAA
jgi:DNA-binding NarL/FixJ family response regulator